MIADRVNRLRKWLGVALMEAPRYRRALATSGRAWLGLSNRKETTAWSPDGTGVACNWEWTSALHAPAVMPRLARALLRRALVEFPVKLADAPSASRAGHPIDVSFVIGHRGLDRLPLLLATLRSIAAQESVNVECVVVEQSVEQAIARHLPTWVRYVHTPPPRSDMPYARGWALNVGARHAKGRLLVLHDNDLLVPAVYAADHLRLIDAGNDVANLKRFIFYLTQHSTACLLRQHDRIATVNGVESILQNALGGGSLAISRRAFFEIGGFDEDFIGWGGEDNELWDRIMTRAIYQFGHLPLIHLWHAPQAGKRVLNGRGLHTAELTDRRRKIPPQDRVAELRERSFGAAHLDRYAGP